MWKKIILNQNQKERIKELLIDIIEWEYDRVSSFGQETLDKIKKIKIYENSIEFRNLLVDLDWELDRMSSSWKEYMEEIYNILEIE